MNVRPLHDRLIVQRFDDAPPKKGAIIIPDSAKEKSASMPHAGIQ